MPLSARRLRPRLPEGEIAELQSPENNLNMDPVGSPPLTLPVLNPDYPLFPKGEPKMS
jgi:hypothetical protein